MFSVKNTTEEIGQPNLTITVDTDILQSTTILSL